RFSSPSLSLYPPPSLSISSLSLTLLFLHLSLSRSFLSSSSLSLCLRSLLNNPLCYSPYSLALMPTFMYPTRAPQILTRGTQVNAHTHTHTHTPLCKCT